MRRRVVLTTQARHDLEAARAWLRQSGAGFRARALAKRIEAAARTLTTSAGHHPIDRFISDSRQLVVAGYVVRYVIVSNESDEVMSIERIYGPGQDRTS